MLMEFSVLPLGTGPRLSGAVADLLKIVHASGLAYQLTPLGTCVEGEWEDLFALVKRCHEKARESATHVVTTIRLEDDAGETGKLQKNVRSVEEKLGHRAERRSA